jgi:tight adherence protein B
MDPAARLVVYGAIFLGVLIAIEGVAQLLGGDATERAVNRRLRMLASGVDPEEVLALLRRQPEQHFLSRVPWLDAVPRLVTQSGVSWRPNTVVVALAAAMVALAVLAGRFVPWPVALVAGIVLGGAVPLFLLSVRRSRRLNAVDGQLPDTIDLMVRSLRAGHPLNTSFQVIAREMSDPIGTEMGIVADGITYGEALPDAVDAMARRVGSADLDYLAVAVKIQHGTGGNLAAVMETLSRVIRERSAMRRKIRALSAEGRITAIVVSAIPPVLAGFIHLTTPSFYGDVADDPLFLPMIMAGIVLTLLNAIILRRLVNFHF